MYTYHTAPIDTGWSLLPTVPDIAAKLAQRDAGAAMGDGISDVRSCEQFLADFEKAKELAGRAGWEGDYRGHSKPRVFFIPSDGTFAIGFVWKQDNNGATFIVSEEELPHLNDLS